MVRKLKTPPTFVQSNKARKEMEGVVGRNDLERIAGAWLRCAPSVGWSSRTVEDRRITIRKLLWWMDQCCRNVLDSAAVKDYLSYVVAPCPEGRWGNHHETESCRPATQHKHFSTLRSLFRWAVGEDMLDRSPVEHVKAPILRQDQIQPFSEEQVRALIAAARVSDAPERNEAIVLFLLDTGVRAAELCDLKRHVVDVIACRAIIQGKGNKQRAVFFSRTTARALNKYYRRLGVSVPRSSKAILRTNDESPVFLSERECGAGKKMHLTPNGLRQLVERLGLEARIRGVRCSPHTFRHTFAVMFLRAGGHVYALRELLGHETLVMTMRYAAIAQADVQAQHAQFSPVEHMRK